MSADTGVPDWAAQVMGMSPQVVEVIEQCRVHHAELCRIIIESLTDIEKIRSVRQSILKHYGSRSIVKLAVGPLPSPKDPEDLVELSTITKTLAALAESASKALTAALSHTRMLHAIAEIIRGGEGPEKKVELIANELLL